MSDEPATLPPGVDHGVEVAASNGQVGDRCCQTHLGLGAWFTDRARLAHAQLDQARDAVLDHLAPLPNFSERGTLLQQLFKSTTRLFAAPNTSRTPTVPWSPATR